MSALRARIMNILYLDTSQNVLTAGVLKGAENFPRSVDAGKNGHTRIILSEIDAALKEAGLDVSEIDAVAAVTGPGSFTGIRIGAATASALCRGTGAAKIAVTEFEIIAYNRAKAYAAVEAGRGNLYFAECEDGVTVRTGFIPAGGRGKRAYFPFLAFGRTRGYAGAHSGGKGGERGFRHRVRAVLYEKIAGGEERE